MRPLGIDLGAFFVIWVLIMLTGAANGVNLADGMDGLAAGSAALVVGLLHRHRLLAVPQPATVPDPGRLPVARSTRAGHRRRGHVRGAPWLSLVERRPRPRSSWATSGPRRIGGLLAALALLTNTQLLLVILGAIFVAETLSVMLQVASFKLFGRRIFRMTPLHFHFDLGGWPETTVVIRFWILTGLGVALGLGFFYADFLILEGVL